MHWSIDRRQLLYHFPRNLLTRGVPARAQQRRTQVNSCDICSVFFLKSRRQGEGPTAKWPGCKSRLLFFVSRKQPACDDRGIFFLKSRRQGWRYRKRTSSTLRTRPSAGNDELGKKTPRSSAEAVLYAVVSSRIAPGQGPFVTGDEAGAAFQASRIFDHHLACLLV